MRVFAISLFSAILLVAWAEPAAAVGYCPPEYQTCEGTGTSPGSGTGGGGTGIRDGYRHYGYPYSICSTTGRYEAKCWECVWYPLKRTEVCGGVQHDGNCSCKEKYSNYILIECSGYGYCRYSG
jgi:hypothetical protein